MLTTLIVLCAVLSLMLLVIVASYVSEKKESAACAELKYIKFGYKNKRKIIDYL